MSPKDLQFPVEPEAEIFVFNGHRSMKIKEAYGLFIAEKITIGLTGNTIADYRVTLERFLPMENAAKEISNTLKKIVGGIASHPTWSKGTKWRHAKNLKTFGRWCSSENICEPFTLKIPPQPQTKVQPLSPEQIQKIISTLLKKYQELKGDAHASSSAFVYLRDATIIHLIYDCGLRQGEVRKLRVQDVDLVNRWLFVKGKGDKDAYVPFTSEMAKRFVVYLKARARKFNRVDVEEIFVSRTNRPLTRNAIVGIFKRLRNRFGFNYKDLRAHTIRHSFAVGYLNRGGDVFSLKNILRHSSLKMTEHYVHFLPDALKNRLENFSPTGSLSATD